MKKILIILIISVATVAFAQETSQNYNNKISKLIAQKDKTSTKVDYSNLIVYLNSVLAHKKGVLPGVETDALVLRAETYIEIVERNLGPAEYLNNAKIDVAKCLTINAEKYNCYLPAIDLYLYDGNVKNAERTLNKVISMLDKGTPNPLLSSIVQKYEAKIAKFGR